MPFTEAVLLETLRIGNVVPNALPHTAEGYITIDGKVRYTHKAELCIAPNPIFYDLKMIMNE